jgi:hypothetical protein
VPHVRAVSAAVDPAFRVPARLCETRIVHASVDRGFLSSHERFGVLLLALPTFLALRWKFSIDPIGDFRWVPSRYETVMAFVSSNMEMIHGIRIVRGVNLKDSFLGGICARRTG